MRSKIILDIDHGDTPFSEVLDHIGAAQWPIYGAAQLTDMDLVVRFTDELDLATFKMQKSPPIDVEAHYQRLCQTPSDIHEHLPYLRELAKGLDVVEFGSRLGASTTAMALSAKRLRSYDIDPRSVAYVGALLKGIPTFKIREQNTIEDDFFIPPCDMLFIDSLHTYKQLREELDIHQSLVEKYIVMHDTVTFGQKSEDGSEPGLQAAIDELLYWKSWVVKEHRTNCNGLMVLERVETPF